MLWTVLVSMFAATPAPAANSAASGAASSADSVTLWAERIYTAPGESIEGGAIVLDADGGLGSIGAAGRPADDDESAIRVAAITAGMIDLSARLNVGVRSVEQSSEIQPHRRAADGLDLFDPRWKRLLETGVTTAAVAPLERNVIGGLSVVVKTGGEATLAARLVKDEAAVAGSIGSSPSSGNRAFGRPTDFYQRRPTTRMGVEWEWRKALYDTSMASAHPERAFEGSDVLTRVLAGELPLFITAWATQDIRTAVFLKEEMQREGLGEIELIIDSAAEAWTEPALLVRSGAAVVLPPLPESGRTNDGAFMAAHTAKTLTDEGVRVALSSHGRIRDQDRLGIQAGLAMRGGMTFDEALAAVTTNPAAILGIEDRVGSIGPGKDVDLVLWSGTPFEPTARVVGVVLNGRLVVDPR